MSDQTDSTTTPIPARRRLLFEGPLFWIGLIVFGLVLAAALSFLPARGDAESAKPDVNAFCAQVDVLGSTDLLSLVAGVTAGSGLFAPGSSTATTQTPTTTGPALVQLDAFEQQLVALERVAPHEVRTDVHEVRLAVDEVLKSLRQSGSTGGIPPSSLLFTISDAQSQIQQAVERMATYTQDTCGIDLRTPSIRSGMFSN
ncbi:MAG: hypothetical protein ACXWCM_08745 [Acidimicrobiales bacterium]